MMQHPHINCGCFLDTQMLAVPDVPVTSPDINYQETLEMTEFLAPYFLLALRLNKYVTKQTAFSMQVYLSGLLNGKPEEWCHTHHLLDSELNRIRRWDMIYLPSSSEDTWNITAEFCAQ